MEQIKNKNTFLVACVSCIVLLLAICYFGINTSFKTTYSTDNGYYCEGNSTLQTFLFGTEFPKVCVNNNYSYLSVGNDGYPVCSFSVSGNDVNLDFYRWNGFSCSANEVVGNDGTPLSYICTKTYYSVDDIKANGVAGRGDGCVYQPYQDSPNQDYPDQYVVQFLSSDDGTAVASELVRTSSSVELPDAKPIHDTKKFVEWNTNADGTGTSYDPGDTVTSGWKEMVDGVYSIKLYAIWEEEKVEYTIMFTGQGADINTFPGLVSDSGVPGTVKLTIPLNVPVHPNGGKFFGWNLEGSGMGIYDLTPGEITTPGGSTAEDKYWWENNGKIVDTIYVNAIFGDKKITLTEKTGMFYNGKPIYANDATYNVEKELTYTYYTDSSCSTKTTTSVGASSSGAAPVDAGSYYVKASIKVYDGDTIYSDCVPHKISPKSVSVVWGNTTFTYNGNEQGPSATVTTGVNGETMTLSTTTASSVDTHTSYATCYSVTGGRTNCDNYSLTNTSKSFTIVGSNNDEDDEPVPEKTFVATFDENGGNLNGSETLSCTTTGTSCKVDNLPNATKSGYIFKGWDTSASCTSGDKDSLTLTKNTTYHACYEEESNDEPEDVTPKPSDKDNVTENPTTGDIAIAITWFVGLLAVGYSFYYFKSVKEN